MNRRLAIVLVAISFLGWHSRVDASLIPITNAGFEDVTTSTVILGSTTGWTLTGAGGGIWNINVSPYGYWNVGAPEGNQIGALSVAPWPGGLAEFSQTLSAPLVNNTLYTLTGQVGDPLALPATYIVELLAGSNVLASTSSTAPLGSFTSFSVVFNSTGSTFVGQNLGIRLSSLTAQTGFDNLVLDGSPVPLPPSLLLIATGVLGMAGYGWRRTGRRSGRAGVRKI